ncbi:MAG: hypothetical protein OER86_14480, partial [Phycisphaerae bacterium]|nr:hypothetical protein [Phycisphaerae bacterium]
MSALPTAVSHYLESLLAGHKSPAVIKVDRAGKVIDAGGNLACYGIEHLEKGRSLSKQLPVFEGLLPADREPVTLPAVHTADAGVADVHLIAAQDGDWVLLLRAEAAVDGQQPRQQTVNELALVKEERDRLEDKLRALNRGEGAMSGEANLGFEMFETMNIVALEYQGDRKFKLLSPPTPWFRLFVEDASAGDEGLLLGDRFTFIGNFLADGDLFWRQKRPGQLKSGLWSELSDQGEEYHLEATAFRLPVRS